MSRQRAAASILSLVVIGGALTACAGDSPAPAPSASTGSSAAPAPSASATTASVPLTSTNASGDPRLTVQISVGGGAPFTVLLDTGSSGLYIDSAAAGSNIASTGQSVAQDYLGGNVNASIVTAPVTIGDVTTAKPIAVGLIDSSTSQGIFGGTQGIMGVSPSDGGSATTGMMSPIVQLPTPYNQGLQIDAPSSGAGTLQLGKPTPAPGTVSTPLTSQTPPVTGLGVPFWDKNVNLCWTVAASPQACGPTVMDSGAPRTAVTDSASAGASTGTNGEMNPGQQITVATAAGQQLWSFTTGTTAGQDLVAVENLGTGTNYLSGIGFYFANVVGFDWADGTLLVTPKQ